MARTNKQTAGGPGQRKITGEIMKRKRKKSNRHRGKSRPWSIKAASAESREAGEAGRLAQQMMRAGKRKRKKENLTSQACRAYLATRAHTPNRRKWKWPRQKQKKMRCGEWKVCGGWVGGDSANSTPNGRSQPGWQGVTGNNKMNGSAKMENGDHGRQWGDGS